MGSDILSEKSSLNVSISLPLTTVSAEEGGQEVSVLAHAMYIVNAIIYQICKVTHQVICLICCIRSENVTVNFCSFVVLCVLAVFITIQQNSGLFYLFQVFP